MAELNHSALKAMHQRYEAATAEFNVIDETRSALRPSHGDAVETYYRQLDEACSASIGETDALRTAILHQVPQDADDVAILHYHIAAAYDMMLGCETYPKHEQEALTTAINTMLDYACGMAPDVQQLSGDAFAYCADQVNRKRRYRTGLVEA